MSGNAAAANLSLNTKSDQNCHNRPMIPRAAPSPKARNYAAKSGFRRPDNRFNGQLFIDCESEYSMPA